MVKLLYPRILPCVNTEKIQYTGCQYHISLCKHTLLALNFFMSAEKTTLCIWICPCEGVDRVQPGRSGNEHLKHVSTNEMELFNYHTCKPASGYFSFVAAFFLQMVIKIPTTTLRKYIRVVLFFAVENISSTENDQTFAKLNFGSSHIFPSYNVSSQYPMLFCTVCGHQWYIFSTESCFSAIVASKSSSWWNKETMTYHCNTSPRWFQIQTSRKANMQFHLGYKLL